MVIIKECELEHVDELVPAFDSYRQRFKQSSNLDGVQAFLQQRVANKDARILIAIENMKMTGFALLYPSFSSIGMAPILVLNDFYVFAGNSKRETALALLDGAVELCSENSAIRIEVTTRKENHRLHALYRDYGFEKDYKYDHYFLRTQKEAIASNMLK